MALTNFNLSIDGYLNPSTLTITAINATDTATAAAILGGVITSTAAANVTITLPNASLVKTAFLAIGRPFTPGQYFQFIIRHLGAGNTISLADSLNGSFTAPANNAALATGTSRVFYGYVVNSDVTQAGAITLY